jgi:RNA polymerase sigma-70 factor (ECF subfamily)
MESPAEEGTVAEHPDAVLVERSRKGDRKAYGELVRRHSRRVFAICLGILGNSHDAEDVAQQALVRGFERLATLEKGSEFAAWVAAIARNLCIDFGRRKRPKEPLEANQPESAATTEAFPDVHEALKRLPEEYRLPLVLYYFDGQSTQKVAGALNISPAGVLTRLSRARRKLRKILEAKQGGKP